MADTAKNTLPPKGFPRLWALLGRAFTRRCPICGVKGIFKNWWTLKEHCPNCGYRFDREEGYFLGGYALNVIFTLFFAMGLMIIFLITTDYSWIVLELIFIPLIILTPIVIFPYTRMLWMALDLMVDRTERSERRLRHEEMKAAERRGDNAPE